ncbi:MAG: hypothetical protein ACRDRL_01680 [Sciscionella sp.]
MSCPSATLVVWASAWLHGTAAADDLLDAISAWEIEHHICAFDEGTAAALELPTRDEPAAAPATLLGALRRAGVTGGGMVLPVPGDVRGLGGRSAFAEAALSCGEAVVLAGGNLGLVPERFAEGIMRWTVFDLPDGPPREQMPISEAENELAGSMRAAATALIELGVARHRPNVRGEMEAIIAARPQPGWPEGMPNRAARVLQRADELEAILTVAATDSPGGALSASAARARDTVLRPLQHAVRGARQAAVDEAVRVFSEQVDPR